MSNETATPIDRPPVPTIGQLFWGFAAASLSGFGGVLPWARRLVVDQRRWMSQQEFNEVFAFCQFLPGPNIVNFTVVFGSRSRGVMGALAALAGVLGGPIIIMIALGALYARFGQFPAVQGVLSGLVPAAAGLIVAVSARMAEPIVRKGLNPALVIATAIFVAIGVLRWPMLAVLAVAVPASVALTAWWRR
jgi:chromate transporter